MGYPGGNSTRSRRHGCGGSPRDHRQNRRLGPLSCTLRSLPLGDGQILMLPPSGPRPRHWLFALVALVLTAAAVFVISTRWSPTIGVVVGVGLAFATATTFLILAQPEAKVALLRLRTLVPIGVFLAVAVLLIALRRS